jgi:predicted nuclease of predicted toxin-antitoxin system
VKLLFDENLSPRLVRLLNDVYPGCTHIHLLGMDQAEDAEIWRFAAAEGYTIVTKDADFDQRSFAYGHPPKVIWIRLGNCSVADSANLLRERFILVQHFHEDPEAALLHLG